MNYYPPQEHPAKRVTLNTLVTGLHKKIKQRAELVLELDQHPDTTPEQAAECHARSKEFHAQTREHWKALKADLKLINICLVRYEELPFVASPWEGTGRLSLNTSRDLPMPVIRERIKKAKDKLNQ